MPDTAPSRIKLYRLALALLMDEHDADTMVFDWDHLESVLGGVRIDRDGDRYTITRYTEPHPPSREGWPGNGRG